MQVKLLLVIFAALSILYVNADFYFNAPTPHKEDLGRLNLICIPGRTIIKVTENSNSVNVDESSYEDDYRRTHMNFGAKDDEQCEICVCSTEGKDEYCSKRPAMNVNECIVMARATDEYNKNIPYDVDRILANRVRRTDLIYHNDEIPYDISAKCYRGVSYYSNDPNANNTDLDVGSDIESLLDYDTKDICFYCICSVTGAHADCVSRDPFYCDYFRFLRNETSLGKNRYGQLFKQDRPAYFRQLSYRIRRTMDDGMFQLVDNFKSKQRIGIDQQCVPYVSKYSTCTDENSCAGCKECNCDEQGQWVCEDVTKCFGMDSRDLDENTVDMAWDAIEETFKKRNRENSIKHGSPYVPRPQALDGEDELLGGVEKEKYAGSDIDALRATNVQDFMNMQMDSIKDNFGNRFKRSTDNKRNKTRSDQTVKFYHAIEEVNEDTLKYSNESGTIVANKAVPNFPDPISRRSERINGNNSSNPLHIEYKKSKLYDHHIADNKIDTHPVIELKSEINEKLHEIMKNKTKDVKDKNLSKLIVNELKKGIEIVGDKSYPSISNITFVPENDTLTAMAFIAGNLLNKLWHLEQDNLGDSLDSEVLKHEKISDLVELFKEPLTIRQETFLKGALEHLASVMTKGADDKNMPICEQVQKIKSELGISKNYSHHDHSEPADKTDTTKVLRSGISNDATLAAVKKLENVMSLIQKYEEVQKSIDNFKTPSSVQQNKKTVPTSRSDVNRMDQILTDAENQSLSLYGNILGKITKLIVPKKKQKNIITTIQNQNIFKNDENFKSKLKRVYDIDLDNSTFTTKDKVVLDYLLSLRNRNCKITDNTYDSSIAEGDIIQNLSEFLKVKSFVNLLKLLEPEKTTTTEPVPNFNFRASKIKTTEAPLAPSTVAVTTMKSTTVNPNVVTGNLAQTKEKLKGHLKAIIGDLIELQRATGVNAKDGNIKIAEALPCLYNILNSNKVIDDKMKTNPNPLNKVKSVFDSIKEELKNNPETRRASMIKEPRPKAAAVWERVIKNAELNPKTRRQMEVTRPKSFDEVKVLIHSMDGSSDGYKNNAISRGVTPQKRLTLLKTIDVDARIYIGILEKIKLYLDEIATLNPKIGNTINEFLDKTILNIKLDEDVLNNLYKHKVGKKTAAKMRGYRNFQVPNNSEDLKEPSNAKTVKLSRDDIINQLIKNRVQFYLKVKDLEDDDREDDLNVRLAKRILNYLEAKNYTIARELFKVFVAQKQLNKPEAYVLPKPMDVFKPKPKQSGLMAHKEPLIHFQEERGPYMGSDMTGLTKSLMKQLENIKNMKS